MTSASAKGGRRRSRLVAAAAALVGVVLGMPAPALGAERDIPSVSVRPADPRTSDAKGQWFRVMAKPGEKVAFRARISNPAQVPQVVSLYLRDLSFATDGTPSVNDGKQTDLGGWGTADQPRVTIPPGQTVTVGLSVTPPAGASPGDHVGVVVAESAPSGGSVKVVKRVATRLYANVPGNAPGEITLDRVVPSRPRQPFGGEAVVDVTVRNPGRTGLAPTVLVAGKTASGPGTILASSVEHYRATVPVPWYGGKVTIPVEVSADRAPTVRREVSMFVVPWRLIILGLLAVVLIVALLVLLRTRRESEPSGGPATRFDPFWPTA